MTTIHTPYVIDPMPAKPDGVKMKFLSCAYDAVETYLGDITDMEGSHAFQHLSDDDRDAVVESWNISNPSKVIDRVMLDYAVSVVGTVSGIHLQDDLIADSLLDQTGSNQYVNPDDQRYAALDYVKRQGFSVNTLAERMIVRQLVADILALGYFVSLGDDEGPWLEKSDDLDEIMDDVMACEQTNMCILYPNPDIAGKWLRVGEVCLVFGNSPWEVIADQHVSLNLLTGRADALAKAIENLGIF